MSADLEFFDLSQPWGHGMPEWPSGLGIRINPLMSHARDGQRVAEWDGIMHRGTHLIEQYRQETGRDPLEDFPLWEPAHKTLLGNGIPGIENVGGDLDRVTGRRCTFMAFPWRWTEGDGSGVRVVAVTDPTGTFRFERG